jgi:ATP-binding protein involved in chromosome partitioning
MKSMPFSMPIIPGVQRSIAVASGKGGVGKSTTAVQLALAFQRQGLKVGLLDADIYGPSLPTLLGDHSKPGTTSDKKIIPLQSFGISWMSIGLMIPEEAPLIWRGPMIQGALTQLITDVDWAHHQGPLDILLIDTPPGTGDTQLTLTQKICLDGVVIVSTPQDIALIDARKGLNMFAKVGVPILGIIENMSYFQCTHCQEISYIFAHQGAQKEAERLNVPFLGAIPLNATLRMVCDAGTPHKLEQTDILALFDEIVRKVQIRLSQDKKKENF